MIIFDLDGTLADCEHRRHFVDPAKNPDYEQLFHYSAGEIHSDGWFHKSIVKISEPPQRVKFSPDWRAFYQACDQDKRIHPTCTILYDMVYRNEIEIWSGRCESVREKTKEWIIDHVCLGNFAAFEDRIRLKMRPVGNHMCDELLKEKWLDEALAQGKEIDMVFDDRPKVVRMWRRRGIFVFNCLQHDKEF